MRKLKDYVVYYRLARNSKSEIMEYITQGLNSDAVIRDEKEKLYPDFTILKVKPMSKILKQKEKEERIEKYISSNA